MFTTFLGLALKTSLLIVVVGFACAGFRKKSAAYRHFLWTAALALSLLMPFAILYLPSVVVLPASWHVTEHLPSLQPAATGEILRGEALPTLVAPTILVIWTLGALALLIREALASVGLIGWLRRARPLGSLRWAATLDHVSTETGFRKPVRVLESSHVTSPCTWGFMQPVLLLPTAGAEWSEAERRHALLHELAHIRRCDYLSTLLARLACAMHWYNPLVWFAAARARTLQEQACDDAVLRGGGTPSDYAQFLLSIAGTTEAVPGPFRIAMGMTQHSRLYGRVLAILDPHTPRVQPNGFAALAALLPLSCLMFVLAAATAATAQDVAVPEPEEATAAEEAAEAAEEQAVAAEQEAQAVQEEQAAQDEQAVAEAAEVEAAEAAAAAEAATDADDAIAAEPAVEAIPAVPAVPPVPAVPALAPVPAIRPVAPVHAESAPRARPAT